MKKVQTPPLIHVKGADKSPEITSPAHPLSHPSLQTPHLFTCPTTTMAPPPESSQQNSKKASSLLNKLGPYAQREQQLDPSQKTNESPWWDDSQTRRRMQCPLVHYHPLCTTCKTLTPEFCTPSDPSAGQKSIDFSTLSRAVKTPAPPCPCLQGYRLQTTLKTRKMWKSWRNEQFTQAV